MRASEQQSKAMLALIEEWHQSGMRQKDFYEQRNIPAHVFYYWHKCYRKQKGALPQSKSANRFVELKPSPVLNAASIELQLNNGHRIIFHQPISADYLKALIV
jgi:transposase-like protein